MCTPETWRLIDTGPCDGPTNMAVDEALLSCFDPETSLPVLRLYGWQPSALSLGRFQRADHILDLERCAAERVPLVRRITGGGVIWHADELTYALVCAPRHLPPGLSVKESFRVLTAFLLAFYRKLGLDPRYAADLAPPGSRLGGRTGFCFAGRETYDILVDGRKIGGNAQRRLRNVIFQHGSIPLVNRAAEGARFLREPPATIRGETTALAEFGIDTEPEKLRQMVEESFSATFGIRMVPGALTESEAKASRQLRLRHSSREWVMEGKEREER